MILQKLIENIDCTVIKGSADAQVQAVQYDSRKVGKGDLFVCITGFQRRRAIIMPDLRRKRALRLLC